MRTLYGVLGVKEGERDVAVIRAAFKRRALETHPDKLPPQASDSIRQAAASEFDAVRSAAETLSDPILRARYEATVLGQLVNEVGRVSDTFEWSEFTVNDDGSASMECRCGGDYVVVGGGPSEERPVHAECDSCSLVIMVTRG